MDNILARVIVIAAAYVTDMDVRHVHRNYTLGRDTKFLIFVHHVIIGIVVLGAFLTERRLVRLHLLVASSITIMWFLMDGCILTSIQKTLISYTPEDDKAIYGTWHQQALNHLLISCPVILYDFYKLLK